MEVILTKGNNIASRLIMMFTNGSYSHVALRYGGQESDWIIHSTVGGVQPDWWFYFVKKYKKMARFKCQFKVADEAADNAVQKIGHAGYDYQGIFGQGIAIVLGLQKNPFPSDNKYRCTEFLTSWHHECNLLDSKLMLDSFDPEMVAPQQLYDYYLSRPDLFKLMEES